MVTKTIELQIPIPTQAVASATGAVAAVAKAFDVTVPVPTMSMVTGYTAVSPVGITGSVSRHQIPIPTITLVGTALITGGYVLNEEWQIPIPSTTGVTAYSAVSPVAITGVVGESRHQIPYPTGVWATQYTAVDPVAITGWLRQIPIPTISEPSWELWYWKPVDTYLSVEDPATYTDQTTEANNATTNDFDIFPVGADQLDGFLIGMKHPNWDRIRIDLGTAGAGEWTVEWVYWNGTAWVLVGNVQDTTTDFTGAPDRYTITFDQPSLWGLKTINGASRYWIFMRILSHISMSVRPLGTQLWVGEIAHRLKNTRQTMNEQAGIDHMTHLDNTPVTRTKGEAFIWQYKLVDYRDNASQRSLLTPTVYTSTDGGAFTTAVGALTEMAHGWYAVAISAEEANCNRMILMATAAGASQADVTVDFVDS